MAYPAVLDEPKTSTIFNRIWPVRLLAALESFERKLGKKAGPDNLVPDTLHWLDRARGVGAPEYLSALEDMDAFTRAFARGGTLAKRWLRVLVTPVTGMVFPRESGRTRHGFGPDQNFGALVALHAVFQYVRTAGHELALALVGRGLPVGVQLGPAYAREDVLIRLAAQLEQARPWRDEFLRCMLSGVSVRVR